MRGDSRKTHIFHGEYHNPWPENHDQLSNLLWVTWSLDPPRTHGILFTWPEMGQQLTHRWYLKHWSWSRDNLPSNDAKLDGEELLQRGTNELIRSSKGTPGKRTTYWDLSKLLKKSEPSESYIYIYRDGSTPMNLPYDWGNQHPLASYEEFSMFTRPFVSGLRSFCCFWTSILRVAPTHDRW